MAQPQRQHTSCGVVGAGSLTDLLLLLRLYAVPSPPEGSLKSQECVTNPGAEADVGVEVGVEVGFGVEVRAGGRSQGRRRVI